MFAGALICAFENISENLIIIMDDLHTIEKDQVKKLILCLIKYLPKNTMLCFGSREALWKDLLPYKIKGDITELTQKELAFTREEAADILGFDEPDLYSSTEDWPLAIGSFRMLLENGIPIGDISSYGNEALYAYLFHECISNLNPDMVDFLKKSASFNILDAQMLDDITYPKTNPAANTVSPASATGFWNELYFYRTNFIIMESTLFELYKTLYI